MNATDRAERALYVSQDCGGPGAMRARGNVVARLAIGKQPRMRDVRALESAARMAGNDLADWGDNRITDAVMRLFDACRAIPDGEPSSWRDAAVFLIGAGWGGMVTFGVLLAIAARHAS